MRHRIKRAFTLVELLVVIAITSILLGLLFYPIFQGFQITQRVQSQATAQSAARTGVEKIQRELAQATFVFDNANTPIVLPLNRSITYDGAPTNRPPILFAKLDFILPDTTTANNGDPIDPTTGKPLTGGQVRFPLAPGTRVVRYFLGLADNTKPYSNLYEFRREDTSFNPVLLYRVEFDPTNPNLVVPGVASNAPGGFNDPNFFYNTVLAPNGQTFGENWRKLASPVLTGPRLDLLAWRKDGAGELLADLPFRTLAQFSPASVPGDTTKPGFLTAGNAEAPGAPPTLYTTQYGQWTTPFSLTFFRSTAAPGNEGEIKFTFSVDATAPPAQQLRVTTNGGTGSLTTGAYYTAYLTSSGRIFVKSSTLTFAVDPLRGRVETGFPPLAGNVAGAPFYYPVGSNVPTPMVTGSFPFVNQGNLVTTVFRVNTRDPRAGSGIYPDTRLDQGLLGVDLMEPTTLRYYVDPGTLSLAVPGAGFAGDYPSPLRIFGNTDATGGITNFGGILIAPGTERVFGPEIPLSVEPQLLPYTRTTDTLHGEVSALQKEPARRTGTSFGSVTGKRAYDFDQILEYRAVPAGPKMLLRLDTGDNGDLGGANAAWAGLYGASVPDVSPGIPAAQSPDPLQRELRVSYLWQNNFARDVQGHPVNANDTLSNANDFKPEADVLKVDYQTRSLLNIQVGARVYDANAPVPQTIQFSDKVKIGNATR